MKNILLFSTLIITASVNSLTFATEHKHHEHKTANTDKTILIEHTQARETPPGVKVGAGYLSITNTGNQDDKLVSASGDLAPIIQIHAMTLKDNVFRMQQLKGGVVIPAGKTVTLEAGKKHLMFMNLPQPLTAGNTHKVTLNFEKAGAIIVSFPVKKANIHEHHNDHSTNKEKNKHDAHKHH